MQLNIYLIKHPIIQILSHSINQLKEQKQNTICLEDKLKIRSLGLLMIHEIVRKWIKLQSIYIKKIHHSEKIYLLNNKQSFCIVTNIANTYEIILEIEAILPNIAIINANTEELNISQNIHSDKVIILEKFLNKKEIIKIINYLTVNKNIPINQIKIVCLSCSEKELEKISQEYKNLDIYTSRIINNK
uniref:Uracil phosphoribosyltransferase n=1 Tax=Spyridia filamentosa TaxID=196632 RepID=A0A1Z1MKP1_SPYFI|nr:uracil phosphoribosyltransferase [Spyridia filamentosa]ARW66311.1 uracil phosphoribosyltransferase [Spyridia filamentosa]